MSGPGADVAVAKVATLSKHAFEAPHKGSDLNPILTPGGATDSSALVASLQVKTSVSTSSKLLDGAAHAAEQERIKTEIGLLEEKLVRHVSRLSLFTAVILNNA